MLVFLLVSMVVLSVLCREIRFGVTANADILAGKGFLRACVFRIPVFKMRFNFDLKTKTIAPKPIKAAAKTAAKAAKKQRHPFKSVALLLTNLRIRCAEAEVHVGSVRDPLFTTLAYGSVRVLIYSALTFLKARYPSATVSAPLIPEYRSDCFYAGGSAVVYISIADILYGFAVLLKNKLRTRARKNSSEKQQVQAQRSAT